jgi:putative oxidoreductase
MTTATSDFSSASSNDLAATLLRVTNGGLFTFHGLFKAVVFTFAGTAGYFESIGLPGFLGYVTIVVEVLGGLALLAGYKTRIVSLALIPVLLGAAYFGHGGNGFVFSNANGGWEYPAFWAVVMAVQALLGAGAWSVDNR